MVPAAAAPPGLPTRTVDCTAVDVSVCIANWNCRELLRKCLRSLLDNPQGATFEVIVADNGSTDGAAEMVANEFPRVTLIRNRENRGYAAACNQAGRLASGRHLFFINNDTEIPPRTLERLLEHANANPLAGLLGPRLRQPDGAFQIAYRRRPTLPRYCTSSASCAGRDYFAGLMPSIAATRSMPSASGRSRF